MYWDFTLRLSLSMFGEIPFKVWDLMFVILSGVCDVRGIVGFAGATSVLLCMYGSLLAWIVVYMFLSRDLCTALEIKKVVCQREPAETLKYE